MENVVIVASETEPKRQVEEGIRNRKHIYIYERQRTEEEEEEEEKPGGEEVRDGAEG